MSEMPSQPTLILIAGGPGAGKTTLGRALAAQFETGVLLDKDVINSAWVDQMLIRLNDGQVDRESQIYLEALRPLEYGALLAAAFDNLALGKTVFVVAPFGPELTDGDWVRRLQHSVQELGGRVRAIWIETDEQTAKERITARRSPRDAWKLANWDGFAASAQFIPPREDLLVLRSNGQSAMADLVNKAIIYLCLK
ncbi:MAG: AAA family ATPase [Casimicrobiaceae bacterium]